MFGNYEQLLLVKNYTSIGDSFMKNFVRLSEVCTISASKAYIEEEDAWLLNLDKVESKTGRVLEHEVVPKEKLNGSIVQFDTGNVLYSKLRPNLNKVVLPEKNGYATSEMLPLRPCESKLTKGYLAEYLRSDNFVSWAVGKTAGAKMPRLGTKVLMDKMIPLPPLEEQHKIVSLFSVVNHVISLRQQQLAKLDELVKARLVEMFGDFSNNSKNWETILFNQCFDIASSKRILKSEWKSEGIPFLRVRDMVQLATMGKTDNEFFISEELYASLSDADGIPQRGDILVSATSTLGKCYVIGPDERYYFKDADVLRFRPKIDINSVFFMEQMKTDYIKEQIARTLGITTVAHFTIKAAKNISMRYPDIKIQNEFADFVRQVEKSKLFIQKSLEYIKILKKSLMQQYFG